MVQEEQAEGGAPAPQWPPAEGELVGHHKMGTHDFMAKCARSGGRAVEWPPRAEDVYASNPGLHSSGDKQVPPPVPPRPLCYPLKAHSSAPNLLQLQEPKIRSKPGVSMSSTNPDIKPNKVKSIGVEEEEPIASTTTPETSTLDSLPSKESGKEDYKMETLQTVSSSSSSQQNQVSGDPNLPTVYPSTFKLRSEMPVQQESAQVFPSQPAFKSTKPIKMRGDSKWPPTGKGPEDTTQEEVREFIKPKKQNKDYSGFFAQHQLPSNYTGYRAPPGTQHVGCDEDCVTDM